MTELNVTKKSIGKLFSEMQNKKYIIPDYQRPYKWDEEICETLWDDITNFFKEGIQLGKHSLDEYFLGTIVTIKEIGAGNEIEIIDGQQRLTSFFLMLRAFYAKLEKMTEGDSDSIAGLKSKIAPCLWTVNPITNKVTDPTKIHIESRVASVSDNDDFHEILRNGIDDDTNSKIKTKGKKISLYASNYLFFKKQCDKFAENNPMLWYELCVYILDKCIILPVDCENQDIALAIFNTLNDRGLPLSDSDIFKAKIYKMAKSKDEKKNFTKNWRDLTETAEDAKIALDDLFRYYTHIIRAQNGDKSKEIGLRSFYQKSVYKPLEDPDLIKNLSILSIFWSVVNAGKSKIMTIEDNTVEVQIINAEARKYLQSLQCYPNEFWKYAVSVFFYKNYCESKNTDCFVDIFTDFLKKLSAFLFAKFIVKPTVNAIKDDIYQMGINIMKGEPIESDVKFDFNIDEAFKNKISETSTDRISRGLILLHAYQNPLQNKPIPDNFEIEHIFPKKWQNTNYNGWNKDDAEEYLEKYGNKVAIEEKVNIQAGNGYFGRKKDKYYVTSKIEEVLDLSRYLKNDWVKDDIDAREEKFKTDMCKFFKDNLRKSDQAL